MRTYETLYYTLTHPPYAQQTEANIAQSVKELIKKCWITVKCDEQQVFSTFVQVCIEHISHSSMDEAPASVAVSGVIASAPTTPMAQHSALITPSTTSTQPLITFTPHMRAALNSPNERLIPIVPPTPMPHFTVSAVPQTPQTLISNLLNVSVFSHPPKNFRYFAQIRKKCFFVTLIGFDSVYYARRVGTNYTCAATKTVYGGSIGKYGYTATNYRCYAAKIVCG